MGEYRIAPGSQFREPRIARIVKPHMFDSVNLVGALIQGAFSCIPGVLALWGVMHSVRKLDKRPIYENRLGIERAIYTELRHLYGDFGAEVSYVLQLRMMMLVLEDSAAQIRATVPDGPQRQLQVQQLLAQTAELERSVMANIKLLANAQGRLLLAETSAERVVDANAIIHRVIAAKESAKDVDEAFNSLQSFLRTTGEQLSAELRQREGALAASLGLDELYNTLQRSRYRHP